LSERRIIGQNIIFDLLNFILSYEAVIHKPEIPKVYPPILRITPEATILWKLVETFNSFFLPK
jgi:hypothetical protein